MMVFLFSWLTNAGVEITDPYLGMATWYGLWLRFLSPMQPMFAAMAWLASLMPHHLTHLRCQKSRCPRDKSEPPVESKVLTVVVVFGFWTLGLIYAYLVRSFCSMYTYLLLSLSVYICMWEEGFRGLRFDPFCCYFFFFFMIIIIYGRH